jgi:large subunit ribosomal protein L19e
MNLSKKKKLAKRTFNVGEDRIVFLESRRDEIKDAITKQDLRDLHKAGAIIIKERKGRTKVRKKSRKSVGNVRKNIKNKKRNYVLHTRKLRKYVKSIYSAGEISKEKSDTMRKKIRNRDFRSKAHLKEYIGGLKK